jgi:secretion/DNA translocation related TadE-like protein
VTARRTTDRGSASILMLGIGMVVLAMGLGCAAIGAAVAQRHAAESAADLAAVAGASRIGVADDSCATASAIAVANGAEIVACVLALAADGRSGSVLVTVRRDAGSTGPLAGRSATATARAVRFPAKEPEP